MASAPIPVWRAFEDNEITHSGAHYLLAIAALARSANPSRRGCRPATRLTRAAASLQLRTLHDHGLVKIDSRLRLALTREGADIVARVAASGRSSSYSCVR